MTTHTTVDPVLALVQTSLEQLEERVIPENELVMAAIVRNNYYIGRSYKTNYTLAIWRTGSHSVEFYDRQEGTFIMSVPLEDQTAPNPDSSPSHAA